MRFIRRRTRSMDCIEFVEVVTDYLESALPDKEARAFELHVASCDGCRTYLEQMRETMRLTGRLTTEDVPAAGTDSLLEAFRAFRDERAV